MAWSSCNLSLINGTICLQTRRLRDGRRHSEVLIAACPFWVNFNGFGRRQIRPVYPQLRNRVRGTATDAKCHDRNAWLIQSPHSEMTSNVVGILRCSDLTLTSILRLG